LGRRGHYCLGATNRHQKALHSYDQQLEYLNTEQYQRAVLDKVERERALLQRMNLLAKPS
jgi:hypothetical protein